MLVIDINWLSTIFYLYSTTCLYSIHFISSVYLNLYNILFTVSHYSDCWANGSLDNRRPWSICGAYTALMGRLEHALAEGQAVLISR